MNSTWNLSVLYEGFDDERFTSDMAELDKLIEKIEEDPDFEAAQEKEFIVIEA